jgi:hypothetical protein
MITQANVRELQGLVCIAYIAVATIRPIVLASVACNVLFEGGEGGA